MCACPEHWHPGTLSPSHAVGVLIWMVQQLQHQAFERDATGALLQQQLVVLQAWGQVSGAGWVVVCVCVCVRQQAVSARRAPRVRARVHGECGGARGAQDRLFMGSCCWVHVGQKSCPTPLLPNATQALCGPQAEDAAASHPALFRLHRPQKVRGCLHQMQQAWRELLAAMQGAVGEHAGQLRHQDAVLQTVLAVQQQLAEALLTTQRKVQQAQQQAQHPEEAALQQQAQQAQRPGQAGGAAEHAACATEDHHDPKVGFFGKPVRFVEKKCSPSL